MNSPSPTEIKAARKDAGLTQTQAADMVYVKLLAWQRWESKESVKTHRQMPAATWDLFLMKTVSLRKKKKPRI